MGLIARQDHEDYYRGGYYYGNNSRWYTWGRWVVLGVILFVFALFVLCAYMTSHRRRRGGAKPYYGTGWMTNNRMYKGNTTEYSQNQYSQPPQYTQEATYGNGIANGAANGYYGGAQQQSGYYGQTGVTQPKPAHHHDLGAGNYQTYSPPPGPPPDRIG